MFTLNLKSSVKQIDFSLLSRVLTNKTHFNFSTIEDGLTPRLFTRGTYDFSFSDFYILITSPTQNNVFRYLPLVILYFQYLKQNISFVS